MGSDMHLLKCLGPNTGEFHLTDGLECMNVRIPECIDVTPLCHELGHVKGVTLQPCYIQEQSLKKRVDPEFFLQVVV